MAHEHAAAMLDGMMSMIESLSELKDREEAAQKHFSAATSLLEKLPGLDCDAGKMLKSKIEAVKFWSESEQESLLQIVNKKTPASSSSTVLGCRLRIQDYTSLAHYLLPSLWTTLCDHSRGFGARTEELCGFAKLLGLMCPSEPTYAHLLSIMHTCCPPQHELSALQKFEVLKSFKVTVKKILAPNDERVREAQTSYITKLPDVPAQLSDHPCYKSAFKNDAPHVCPDRATHVIANARSIPLRCSNMNSFMPLQRASASDNGMAQAMCAMLLRAVAAQPDNNIRVFSSPQPSYDLQNPQLIMRPMGLPNPQLTMLPAAPASESSAGSATTQGVLALTDRNITDEVDVNKGQDVGTEKREVNKEKDVGAVKEKIETDPLKLIQELQDKRTAAVMKRPAAQKKPTKTELRKAATQTPKVGNKKELKKAAVAAKANQKQKPDSKALSKKANQKPAINKKANQKPAIGNKKKRNAKQLSGMTIQRRLLLRPNGCSKCRYKPGCTPSCLSGLINR